MLQPPVSPCYFSLALICLDLTLFAPSIIDMQQPWASYLSDHLPLKLSLFRSFFVSVQYVIHSSFWLFSIFQGCRRTAAFMRYVIYHYAYRMSWPFSQSFTIASFSRMSTNVRFVLGYLIRGWVVYVLVDWSLVYSEGPFRHATEMPGRHFTTKS